MKRGFLYLSGLFVLNFFFSVQVLNAQYRIDSWTTENGLPQNSVSSIVQTRDGYLWMATADGLVRFDGVRFKVFNKSNSEGLDTNRLVDIREDGSGRLWVSGEDGSLRFYENGKFTVVAKAGDPRFNPRSGMIDDGEGGIIFCLETDKSHYQYKDGKFVPWEIAGRPKDAYIKYRDREGGFWFIEGFTFHRVKDGVLQTFHIPEGGRYRNVYQDRFGNFWLIADRASKEIYRVKNNRLQQFETPAYRYWGATEDKKGNLWLHTYESGVVRLEYTSVNADEITTDDFQHFTTKEGFLSDACRTLTTDREGGVWVGSEKGLHHLLPQTVHVFSKKDGLQDDNIYPILEDRNSTIWLGAWQQSLIKYEKGVFSTFLNLDGLPFYSSIFEDRDGKFWLGNIGNLFYLENGKPVRFTDRVGVGDGATFNVISQDKDGNMWFGSSKGLIRYSNGQAKMFTGKDGLPDSGINTFLQTKDEKIWIGTRGGIASLECKTQSGECGIKSFTERDGLVSNYTRSLYEDADGVLWIGSYDGGLTRYKDGKFTPYRVKDGLFSNGVFCILEDNRGWFWMNSNQGIYRVRKQELNDFAEGKTKFLTSISYGRQDGLLNVEGNGGRQPAGIKTRNGNLWFPMAQGVAVINPNSVTTNPLPPNILIEEVLIDRNSVSNDLFQSAIGNQQAAITLSPSQNNLEIQYTGLSFINSEQVKFKYRLEGLEADWNEVGTRRAAYYSYLPAGEYTFHVIAANRDGVWNTEGRTIKVIVIPPFYKTLWFVILCALSFITIVFLVYRYRISQINHARELQQAFTRQLITSQEDERKRIAAELHDSLGQRLVIIKNLALMYLTSSNGNGNSSPHIKDLSEETSFAISEVKEISYNLRPYQLDRIGLTKAIEGLSQKLSVASEINIFCDIDDIDDFFSKEEEINFYRIVQESLNNIVKHSEAYEVLVTVKREDNKINLMIKDDGKGFDTHLMLNAKTKTGGFGLIGIFERAQLLNSKPHIQSALGHGTVIRMTIEKDGRR